MHSFDLSNLFSHIVPIHSSSVPVLVKIFSSSPDISYSLFLLIFLGHFLNLKLLNFIPPNVLMVSNKLEIPLFLGINSTFKFIDLHFLIIWDKSFIYLILFSIFIQSLINELILFWSFQLSLIILPFCNDISILLGNLSHSLTISSLKNKVSNFSSTFNKISSSLLFISFLILEKICCIFIFIFFLFSFIFSKIIFISLIESCKERDQFSKLFKLSDKLFFLIFFILSIEQILHFLCCPFSSSFIFEIHAAQHNTLWVLQKYFNLSEWPFTLHIPVKIWSKSSVVFERRWFWNNIEWIFSHFLQIYILHSWQ